MYASPKPVTITAAFDPRCNARSNKHSLHALLPSVPRAVEILGATRTSAPPLSVQVLSEPTYDVFAASAPGVATQSLQPPIPDLALPVLNPARQCCQNKRFQLRVNRFLCHNLSESSKPKCFLTIRVQPETIATPLNHQADLPATHTTTQIRRSATRRSISNAKAFQDR